MQETSENQIEGITSRPLRNWKTVRYLLSPFPFPSGMAWCLTFATLCVSLFFPTPASFLRLPWDSGLPVTLRCFGIDSGPILYDVTDLVPSTIWPAAISVSFILNSQERESDGRCSAAGLAVLESEVPLRSNDLWQRYVRLHSSLHHQLGLWVLIFWLVGKGQGKLSNMHAASWFCPAI